MHPSCKACGRRHERAPGFFLGSIYFNYAVTAVLVTSIYFALYFATDLSRNTMLFWLGLLTILFPAWFFRYARALWAAFDEFWDPGDDNRD